MSTAGPNAASTIADDASVGTVAWSNPSNAGTSNDSYATATSTTAATHYLNCQGFGFAIPAGATINGITMDVECKQSGNTVTDYHTILLKAGSPAGDDKKSGTAWPAADGVRTYGGAADLWGTTWTPAEVNAANFGCAIAATITNAVARTASVDLITITVTYTEAAAVKQRRALLGVGW